MFRVLSRCPRLVPPAGTRTVWPAPRRPEPTAARRHLSPSSSWFGRRSRGSGPVPTRWFSEERRERAGRDEGAAGEPGETTDRDRDRDRDWRSQRAGHAVQFSLDVLVSLLRQENAVDVCVIRVPEQVQYTDYFIVAGGVSTRHLRAMALYSIKVYKFLRKEGEPHARIEGKDTDDWLCIDFGNMVVHFMLPETREVYELEKLWTLRALDEQLSRIPPEVLPEDFVCDDADVPGGSLPVPPPGPTTQTDTEVEPEFERFSER